MSWTDDDVAWSDEDIVPQRTNSLGEEAARQGGLTARYLVEAAASPFVIGGDAIGKGINAATGQETVKPYSRVLKQALDKYFPTPERPLEQFAQAVAQTAPAMALPASLPAQVGGNAAIGAALAEPGNESSGAATGVIAGALPGAVANILKGAGRAGAHVLGLTTGTGRESVAQAFKGGDDFVANMRGHVEPGAVVEQARQGVANMRQNMREAYKANKQVWAAGQQPLDLAPVAQAYKEVAASMGHDGFSRIGAGERRVIEEADGVLREFAGNPKWHTTEGFDALKQRLQAIYPDNPQMTQARRAIQTVADRVRQTIIEQNPTYAAAMRDYWERSTQLDEIERSLSLGDKNTVDTALRKLQSLMRNNVNSNYGQRAVSAETLAREGGVDVRPAVAGQAMNSWTPRGLQAAAATGGAGIATLLSPKALMAAPAFSPRAVGETARAFGAVADDPRTIATLRALRAATPAAAKAHADALGRKRREQGDD